MNNLVPPEFNKYAEQVLTGGAYKYGADSWKSGRHFSKAATRNSVIRHVLKNSQFKDEQIKNVIMMLGAMDAANKEEGFRRSISDEDSGLLHVKHAATRLLMEAYCVENGIGEWA